MAKKGFCVVLHDVRSAHNTGSIFRTADAAGASKIYCCGITPTPLDRFGTVRADFAKVSLGAERSVEWEHCDDPARALDALKKEGYAIFAVEQSKQSIPYFALPEKEMRGGRFCLVMGNEVKGVPPALLALADRVLEIPMKGNKESLNVAVAFGVVAFGLSLPRGRM